MLIRNAQPSSAEAGDEFIGCGKAPKKAQEERPQPGVLLPLLLFVC